MTLNQLAKEIAKREGKKKQVDIAQISEILRIIVDIEADKFDGFKCPSSLIYYAAEKKLYKKSKAKKR